MSYKQRLKTFFKQNDPDRLYLASKISRAFREDEDSVMKRLEQIYASGGPKNLTIKEIPVKPKEYYHRESNDNNLDDVSMNYASSGEAPKKSKKKLIFIIAGVLCLGVGGYFTYPMLISSDSGAEESENIHAADGENNSEHPADTHAEEPTSHAEESTTDSIINAVEEKIEDAENNSDSTIQEVKETDEVIHDVGH